MRVLIEYEDSQHIVTIPLDTLKDVLTPEQITQIKGLVMQEIGKS